MNHKENLYEIVTIAAKYGIASKLFYEYNEDTGKVHIFINCNDWFAWGLAESMEIKKNDIELFEQSLKDAKEADPLYGAAWGDLLFASRKESMRPQSPYYESIPQTLWDLFDGTGPERELGIGNPYNGKIKKQPKPSLIKKLKNIFK